ncbi:MAG: hypothetical protein J5766_05240 [Clostridia bacterium]|nr:hypothetical protein [Clostridia bacterium]
MKYCPYCRAQLNDSAAFCGSCGSPQPAMQQFEQPTYPPVSQPFQQPAYPPINQPPVEQSFEQPIGQPFEQPFGQQYEQPFDQPVGQPYEQPFGQQYEQPFDQPVGQPFEQPYQQPFEQPYPAAAFDPSAWPQDVPGAPTSQPVYGDNFNYPQPNEDNFSSPVVDAVKKICRSPLVIAIAVLISASIILQFLASYVSFYSRESTIAHAAEQIVSVFGDNAFSSDVKDEIIEGMSDSLSEYSAAELTATIVSLILPLMTAIGFYLVYAAGMQKGPGLKTGGLKTLKVISIIQLVLTCLSAVLIFLAVAIIQFIPSIIDSLMEEAGLILSNVPGGATKFSEIGSTFYTVIYIVLAVFFAIIILYRAMIVASIGAAQKAATEGAIKKVSSFVAVMLFIAAAFTLLSLIIAANPIHIIARLTTAGYQICIGILIFRFNKEMAAFDYTSQFEYDY